MFINTTQLYSNLVTYMESTTYLCLVLVVLGSKFCHHPKTPPKEAYIMTIEETCSKLTPGDSEELRAETSWLLKQKHHQHTKHYQGRI